MSSHSYTSRKLMFTSHQAIFLEALSAEGFRILYLYIVDQENCLLAILLQKRFS